MDYWTVVRESGDARNLRQIPRFRGNDFSICYPTFPEKTREAGPIIITG